MKRNLADFLNDSPTSYQAIDNVREELLERGFTELNETSKYDLKAGGDYFVTRNESAIIAFTIPENFTGIRIVASHSDSPYFKVKENPEMKKGGSYCVLNVEKYGGMLHSPWFDRPLSVAGRIFVEEDGQLVSKHVDLEKPMCMIPSLAIHMDREANSGRAFNPQKDLLPLMGLVNGDETPKLLDQVAAKAGTKADAILGYDLYVYNNEKAIIWGENEEFISGPRLDDLQCVYTSLVGFLNGKRSEALSIYTVFDNEEVGSSTRQGAASTFLRDTLKRIYDALGRSFEDYEIDLAKGFMISADNAHAIHPNNEEKADPVNRPVIGGGVAIKFSGNQKYCTDGFTAAYFRQLASRAGKELQVFTNRSDVAGGSTLGNISNNQVALPTVDIGLPQLAMHSPYETAGVRDGEDFEKIVEVFFN